MSNVTFARSLAALIAVVALAALPYAIKEVYYVNIASQILLYAIFALGLNILVGYAGLVSLGHAGLFGIAAYVVAYLLVAGHGHVLAIAAALAAGQRARKARQVGAASSSKAASACGKTAKRSARSRFRSRRWSRAARSSSRARARISSRTAEEGRRGR